MARPLFANRRQRRDYQLLHHMRKHGLLEMAAKHPRLFARIKLAHRSA